MTWTALSPSWSAADDVDSVSLWARSGAQWLTAPGVSVPTRLVRGVVGIVRFLDSHGAALADVVGVDGLGALAERAAVLDLTASGQTSCGGATRLLQTADEWIALALARPSDNELVPAWLERDVDLTSNPWQVVADEVRDRRAADLVEWAGVLGLSCSRLGEEADARPVLVKSLGVRAPRRVEDTLVVNLASLWAGPLAADVLARCGARVVRIESEDRPDGARLAPRFFDSLHGRTRSVALRFGDGDDQRRLRSLLAAADVVIEGSRPRALQQLGIDASEMVRTGPQVWLSITGHGRLPPNDVRAGLGDDAAVAGGLVGWVPAATGAGQGGGTAPVFVADAVADPMTGLTVAAAAIDLLTRGGRHLVDVALARVAASVAPQPDDPAPASNCDPPRARLDQGRPLPLGRDTIAVLRELGIA